MIIIDKETTGLLKPSANNLSEQPHDIEIYALKLDENFEFVDEFESFVNPMIPIEPHITKITGIDDTMVATAPTFPTLYPELCDLFLGEKEVVAHNVSFDMGMMWVELSRMEREYHFPWPSVWTCTVEKSFHIKNRRMKLSELHELATGTPHKEGAHRARADVHALARCYKWMKEEGIA